MRSTLLVVILLAASQALDRVSDVCFTACMTPIEDISASEILFSALRGIAGALVLVGLPLWYVVTYHRDTLDAVVAWFG